MSPKYNPQDQPQLVDLARKIAKNTCQLFIYGLDTRQIPQSHGCCVLFYYNQRHYALSNAHVLGDEYMGTAFVLTNKSNNPSGGKTKTTTLGGQHYYTKMPASGKREDDIIDMCLVNLTDETVIDLKERGYIFVDLDSIKTDYNPAENDGLLVVGYPATKTRVDSYLKKIIAKPFYLLTTPSTKKANTKFDMDYHVIARYVRKKIFDPTSLKSNTGPLPYGISGSGLWYLERNHTGNYTPYLISILSEYDSLKGVMVGTKIDLFIDLIKQKFDPSISNGKIGVRIIE